MRLLILLLLCSSFWTAQAQRGELKKQIRQDVKALSSLYQLDKEQSEAALAVQERYYLQLEEIASLKDSDYRAYLHKLRAARQGREFGIKKLLRPEQRPAFEAEQTRQKQAYLDKLAALKASGATKETLELAKITIE